VCERCAEIDRKINDLRRALSTADDTLARSLLAIAIAGLQAEKDALHPKENGERP
jgi:hypothetical protein